MSATPFRVVSSPAKAALTDDQMRRYIERHRNTLLRAAVRYVKEAKEMSWHDRLRQASDLSGIPQNYIEIEVKRQ